MLMTLTPETLRRINEERERLGLEPWEPDEKATSGTTEGREA